MKNNDAGSVVKVDTYHDLSASQSDSFSDSYQGLPIHALDGLHGFVAAQAGHFLAPGASVLDLGAGSGAMCRRLMDMGMEVTAIDLVAENFRLAGQVPFISADLNQDFSAKLPGRFGGIVAVEIVEHLENPRNFLRECHRLLNAGGYLVLSTPNIDNPVAKGMYLKSGTFQWFTDYNYAYDGHIMPLSQWLLRKIIEEAGFSIEWAGSFGDPFRLVTSRFKRALGRVIQLFSSCSGEMAGEITVVVLKK